MLRGPFSNLSVSPGKFPLKAVTLGPGKCYMEAEPRDPPKDRIGVGLGKQRHPTGLQRHLSWEVSHIFGW